MNNQANIILASILGVIVFGVVINGINTIQNIATQNNIMDNQVDMRESIDNLSSKVDYIGEVINSWDVTISE